jgi:hypothetical protein
VRVRRFALPRSDSGPHEYEDAAWPDADEVVPVDDRVRVAVADGAAESLLAGAWARLLAQAATRYHPRALRRAVRWAVDRWPGHVTRWLDGREPAWWQLEKLNRGAHATVVVAQLSPDGAWRAAAVGDSCLLHLRDGRIHQAFPVDSPDAFGTRPHLVSSVAPDRCRPVHTAGVCAPGDRLLLATDALAMWLLAAGGTTGPNGLDEVLDTANGAGARTAFADWAAHARGTRALRDDDVTLLVVDV